MSATDFIVMAIAVYFVVSAFMVAYCLLGRWL